MKFKPLASSSKGNAYLVEDAQSRLLVDCGLAFRTMQKAAGFGLNELDGVLVTHEHKDHSRCVAELIKRSLTVYMSAGTALALGLAEEKPLELLAQDGTPLIRPFGAPSPEWEGCVAVISDPRVMLVEDREQFRIGSFDVVAFATYHDAAEPLGYLIRSRVDGDVTVIATDTVNLRYRFPGLRILGIEANYQESFLERAQRLPDSTKHRIRNTHMEIDTLCDILAGMDLRQCREIWLLHLSDAMSHEGQFIHKVERVVPPWVTVRAAGR
ncbi:MAG: MBL fold metallo-hydrolase [Oscillospiraceae bacterium]|nr:MBL fold metallo-hydrolase [Oscillospiraceae bacterium]